MSVSRGEASSLRGIAERTLPTAATTMAHSWRGKEGLSKAVWEEIQRKMRQKVKSNPNSH